jgi:hAT family C-terminal dimerisation region
VSEVGDYMKSGGASRYWNLIGSTIKPSPSALAVERVARKLLSVLPNAADPERLFSELGRLINPARSRMADRQIHSLIVISADYMARQHDVETGGLSTEHTLSGAPKRFSDRAAAVLRLQQAARNGVNSIVSVSDVQLVSKDATVSSNSAGPAENVHLGNRLGNGDDNELESEIDDGEEDHGDTLGLEAEDDVAATDYAISDFSQFTAAFADILDDYAPEQIDGIGASYESDAPREGAGSAQVVADGMSVDAEQEMRNHSIEMYPLGELPNWNDRAIPTESLHGVRGHKVLLDSLFDVNVVGTLRALITIGALTD